MYATKQLTVEFGFIKDYPDTIVDYQGDGDGNFIITIEFKGEATGIRINNVTREEYMIIDDTKLNEIMKSGIIQYDTIVINTAVGKKSAELIRDGVSHNIIHAIDLSSKWIRLQKGENRFTCTSKTGLDNMVVTLSYKTRVLGV